MRQFIKLYVLLTLSEKIGWGSALVGTAGFLLAIAIGYPGAHRTGLEAAQLDKPTASLAAIVMLDQRRDRLDQPEQKGTKADLLIDTVPSLDQATDRKEGLPLVSGDEPAAPAELGQPQSLVSWLEDETTMYNLSTASASGSVVLVPPNH